MKKLKIDNESMGHNFFAGNRKRLIEKLGEFSPIVISANGLIQRTRDDDAFPFEQDSNFWYLTGVNEPDVVLVIDISEEYLILPERSSRHRIFSEQINKDNIKAISGIKNIYDHTEGWEKLSSNLKRSKSFYTPTPPDTYLADYDIYTNPASRTLSKKIKSINHKLKQKDITREIIELRMVKSDIEISSIRRAIEFTAKILVDISNNIDNYKNEHDIAADINDFYFRKNLKYAFSPIIAAGGNATILHYNSNDSSISSQSPVLIDTGVKFNNYCSDITRTLIRNENPRQKAVYDAVARSQAYAMKLLKPGITIRDYETNVAKYIGEELKKLGLIRQVTGENVRKYYPHGTSHSLGVDVHDPADYTKPLKPGMVVTVEPGIYIPQENIGIRIEDDVLITKDGIENLSAVLSSDTEKLSIMSQE